MKALFTTQPTFSHWYPLVPLARAVQNAGHEIAFATTARFSPTIEAQGFRCLVAGPVDTPEERARRRELTAGLSPRDDTIFTLRYVFAGVRAERSLPPMLDIIRDWHPDIVVRENTEFAGCIAAERLGIPHVVLQITALWTYFMEAVEAPLASLCQSAGLAPENLDNLLYRYLMLSARPPSLWNPSVPQPDATLAFHYASPHLSGEEALPAWVATLDERPTVYATLGTFDNERTDVLLAILEGLREEPVNLILTVGRNRDPGEFGPQPPNVHIERFIPQTLLLPHCDMVLCHGGTGTMMGALGSGLPMVMVPIAADQPENAERCAEVGVARIVDQASGAEMAPAIRDATRQVLGDPRYRQAARRMQEEINALPAPEYVASVLEQLAAHRTPSLS